MNWISDKYSAEKRWDALTAHLISSGPVSEVWKSFRGNAPLRGQGWKIHVSAQAMNACDVFEKVSGWLEENQICFKTVKSLDVLCSLNAGVRHGYSQIGKFMTIYPASTDACKFILADIGPRLKGFDGPRIPYDHQLAGCNCVFFRYGAFAPIDLKLRNKRSDPKDFVRGPNGHPLKDQGRRTRWVPHWETLPAETGNIPNASFAPQDILPFLTLSRNGKGGVFKAMDLEKPLFPMTRILKQGLRGGAMDWSRTDGAGRLFNETNIVSFLSTENVPVPKLIRGFETDAAVYRVFEYIDGSTLDKWLTRSCPGSKLRLSIAIAIAKNLAVLHHSGLAWRDLKYTNILVQRRTRNVYFIDFEGAVPGNAPLDDCWGSPTFVPPEFATIAARGFDQDIFAFGRILDRLLEGENSCSRIESLVGAMRAAQGLRPTANEVLSELLKSQSLC
jgi:hypothetical protein